MTAGLVVREYGPWRVVRRPDSRHVVVDTSGPLAPVFGPASRKECEAWCRTSMGLLRAVDGQMP